mmetsp:Transcript_22679/g.37519  ORF Transcript_22679/g.37519 Transcript_22679/m.37519 type:complete len:357 (+) Transcript_22679:100-1170(+)|eukprot:CAMPEP_0119010722 /NCGR_PEP_ID=MMETSP1176-20130426/5201_1 /TAXON_ID=265551 /ORGANISM="Synedropsis recta cf, Strain CCMP1620" /LENGTH=356 /DNA_ID=CAMNT_0006963435 /DNA_START=101 /DNA_END=1171 /DNA_ORIENTATION=-
MAGDDEIKKDEDAKGEEDKQPAVVEETEDTATATDAKKEDTTTTTEAETTDDKDGGTTTKKDNDNDKSKKRKTPATAVATAPSRAGKRDRKAASTFVPADTFKKDARVTVMGGRGSRLSDVSDVADSIQGASNTSAALLAAFKLLFTARGKVTGAAMKGYLLDFSGYLPVLDDDVPDEKRNKLEEDAEAKASKKAYKFKTQEIKMLCDFFTVDRSGVSTKEALIDRLLDFLGEINDELLKTSSVKKPAKKVAAAAPKKKATKKKKAVKAKEESAEEESEEEEQDDDEEEEEQEANDDGTPSKPNDKVLRRWVKAYIACFNMDKATIKHAIETASDKFGMDLADKKQKIKQLLTEEM